MLDFTKAGKLVKKSVFIIVLLAVSGMLTAQSFRVEGEAGLSLFNISDPTLKAKMDAPEYPSEPTKNMVVDLKHKNSFFAGAYGGYNLGNVEIGAELSFTNSKGTSNDSKIDGDIIPDTAGRYNFSMFKIGPTLRYYFNNANPQIEPFAGVSGNYVSTTIDINDPALKFEQAYLDIGFSGGALYWMQENLYVGGMARVDIYNTIKEGSLSGVDFDMGTPIDVTKITTDGWTPLSIFFVIGTKL